MLALQRIWGAKRLATDSNGEHVTGRQYRKLEAKLFLAQRAKHKSRIKVIHAKIKNRRLHDLHKYSCHLVNDNAAIFVDNVNSLALVKTKMAKSVLDAGLRIREWICSECGAEHNRYLNAVKNILAVGHDRLAVGIPHYNQLV